jgi:hypothetical protein
MKAPTRTLTGTRYSTASIVTFVRGPAKVLAPRHISGKLLLAECLRGSDNPPRSTSGSPTVTTSRNDALARLRQKFQPCPPPRGQCFHRQVNFTTTMLPVSPAEGGEKRLVVDVVDLRLIMTRDDRAGGIPVIGLNLDHGLDGLVFRMTFEESHHMQIVAAKPQGERLENAGRHQQRRADIE